MNQGLFSFSSKGNPEDKKNFYVTPGYLSESVYSLPSVSYNLATTANQSRLHFSPIYIYRKTRVVRIGYRSGSIFTSGTVVRLGIYNNKNGIPTTCILDSGDVTGTAINTAYEAVVSESLDRGWYWLAFYQTTSGTPRFGGFSASPFLPNYAMSRLTGGFAANAWYIDTSVIFPPIQSIDSLVKSESPPLVYIRTTV